MPSRFDNPWTTLSSRDVYDNAWISVREDGVLRPDGAPGIYGVVHMKNKAIGIVAIDADDHIYLVGQYRYPLDCYSWEIVEGGGPHDEDALDAAKRELHEETGLIAANWRQLGTAHLSNSVTDEEAIYFLATDLTQHEAQPEGTEQLEVCRVPFDEALQMVENGEITDGLSIIGILRYAMILTTDEHR